MSSHFTSDFFKHNRAKLRTTLKSDHPIVLTAHGLLQRNSDTTFPFRQDSSFWYLTGISEPDIILVMAGEEEFLIVPKRESIREAFDGSIDASDLSEVSGIAKVLAEKTGWNRLRSILKQADKVATLAPPSGYVDALGFYTNPARQQLVGKMQGYNPDVNVVDIRDSLMRLRSIKQKPELDAIQEAIDITAATLGDISKDAFGSFKTEYEIEAAITAGFRSRKAGHGYSPIVAGGGNACTLHYIQNNDDLKKGDLILLDVGAEVENYSADVTRTYAYGQVTARQQEVYEAVVEVQKFAMGLLKSGVIIKQYEKQIEGFMGEQLLGLGLIHANDRESVREFYPHATSHFLGLDVHDVGDYERPLEPGMVLTVEPGIYIPAEGIGVRIEDNVVITEDGINVLTANLPKSLS